MKDLGTWFIGAYIVLFAVTAIILSLIPCLFTAIVLCINDSVRK